MIKKFFIAMLGSMAALWLSLLIFILGVTIMIAKFASSQIDVNLSNDQVLHIVLEGPIEEYPGAVVFEDLLLNGINESSPFSEILTSINLAKTDKKVKGILIDCKGGELGIASRSELIEALNDFRKSGKWVYAYADEFMQGDYYMASCADRVFLNPVGSLDLHGLCVTVMYYEDVLKKLGIDINVVKVGTFKSAVEPYMRMDMSEANRKQTTIFLNQLWGDVTEGIAAGRSLEDAQQVNEWAQGMVMTWAPEQYLEKKLVTDLAYRSEMEDAIRKQLKKSDKDDLPLVTVAEYMTLNVEKTNKYDDKHIAVLFAAGDITENAETGIASETMVPIIKDLATNDKVKGLVLRVNSGGGSAFASEQIWKALEDFKATGKPYYVSMGDYAASGGYYISCGADKIYADASTLTGSIGIFGIIPNAQNLFKDKIGLGIDTVSTGPNANFPSLMMAPTQVQLDGMQKYVERGYDTFTSRVAQGRSISVDSVKVIGEGRVWDGMSALRIGLVDEIGSLDKAVSDICDKASVKKGNVAFYPEYETSALDLLMTLAQDNVNISLDLCGTPVEGVSDAAKAVGTIRRIHPVQARMEKIIVK